MEYLLPHINGVASSFKLPLSCIVDELFIYN